ncbi:hypothetical protein GA230_21580 [Escherichia coli]|nr:hypothetical protein [Escherichia coli]
MKMPLCAVGVVPTRVYPQSGRISALAGREGRLRACMRDVHWFLLAFISSQVLNGVRLEKGKYPTLLRLLFVRFDIDTA